MGGFKVANCDRRPGRTRRAHGRQYPQQPPRRRHERLCHLKELEQALRDHDAALSMGVDLALGTHTVTVFTDGPQLFVRDPGRRGFHAISGLQDIGKLVDSVLYIAK